MRAQALLLFCALTGVNSFEASTRNANVEVKENEGADLTCSYSGDFGANPRIEWKFQDAKGSQAYVVFFGKPTGPYADRVSLYGGSNLRFTKVTRLDNGRYDCEVSASEKFSEVSVQLTVLVPPSAPVCRIPTTGTTGRLVKLSCYDGNGSPPPTYRWYKDGTPLPQDPSQMAAFKNLTYKLDPAKGELVFIAAKKQDSGSYHCESANKAGPPQSCRAVKVEIRDPNVGGIVAGVIVALLLVALLVFGIWYAYKKGYLPQKSDSKQKSNVVYQPPSSLYSGGDDDDGDFKQKSSFVV
ncbi:unnamed protein product [Ophioblennius macclurei]